MYCITDHLISGFAMVLNFKLSFIKNYFWSNTLYFPMRHLSWTTKWLLAFALFLVVGHQFRQTKKVQIKRIILLWSLHGRSTTAEIIFRWYKINSKPTMKPVLAANMAGNFSVIMQYNIGCKMHNPCNSPFASMFTLLQCYSDAKKATENILIVYVFII